ncbi:MAG: transposase [Bryobacterales bacterium]|nr:transposase [Bryobacterales bacterium]
MTIPGVDFPTAQSILAMIDDWSRFPGADKAAAYFRLVPSLINRPKGATTDRSPNTATDTPVGCSSRPPSTSTHIPAPSVSSSAASPNARIGMSPSSPPPASSSP